jgi:lipid-A-disaccharide synthase
VVATLPAFEDLIAGNIRGAGLDMPVASGCTYEALAYSDLAIASSGTATLEAALLGTPVIVIYRLALFSWAVGRLIVKVPHISLVNLVADRRVIPEYVQGAVNPKTLAAEAALMLTDQRRRAETIGHLDRVRETLGAGGATARAARIALDLISE